MTTKTAFNPFEHSRLFFMAGVAISLGIIQLAFGWNGMHRIPQLPDLPKISDGTWVEVEYFTEKVEEQLPEKQVQKEEVIIPEPDAPIKVVDDVKKITTPIKLNNPEKDPVGLKGPSRTATTTTGGGTEKKEIGTIVEVMPAFPGGYEALYKWLAKNTSYPKWAKDAGIEGTVYVEFILGTDGKVQSAKVLRGIGGGCDEEVLNAVLRMPAWNPAKQGNVEVPLRMTIPFTFKIS